MISIGAVTQRVQAGRLGGRVVSTAANTAASPEVPTLEDAELAGIAIADWHGIVTPHGTDTIIVTRVNQAVGQVRRLPEVRDRQAAPGIEPMDQPAASLAAKLRADATRWAGVIQRLGMPADRMTRDIWAMPLGAQEAPPNLSAMIQTLTALLLSTALLQALLAKRPASAEAST